MRTTLMRHAKAQYKWHRHTPLIRFTGPRKALWDKAASESKSAQALPAGSTEAIEFWELPARYRPLAISPAEIEAIESGGASLD
ncbi:hypothetical protein H4R20_004450 [Coemansia guatemalensis]|uniref:Uncharacterized protein n=1 Tax=Coemansia guatemalensis TaxID=2761395 RepID=A0A9W8HTA7_9FUNG|nr:hypothetical protein H4R20_004450 [Coemansia guatemalensis]